MYKSSKIIFLSLIFIVLISATLEALQKKPKVGSNDQQYAKETKISANYGKYGFTFTTLAGKTLRLSDYAGKIVLVNIWAPWCGPCRVEIPGFLKLYQRYHNDGFEIISVAVQTNERDVRSFVEKYKMTWPVGLNDEVASKYGTYGLPDNYLFKPDGSVAKHLIGLTREETLKPLIEEALKERPSRNSR